MPEISAFGPILISLPIMVPEFIEEFIPVATLSPMIAPSFLLEVLTRCPLCTTVISFLSNLKFAILVPEPKLQFLPITESPT